MNRSCKVLYDDLYLYNIVFLFKYILNMLTNFFCISKFGISIYIYIRIYKNVEGGF